MSTRKRTAKKLSPAVQVAIVTALGTIIVAVITGLVTLAQRPDISASTNNTLVSSSNTPDSISAIMPNYSSHISIDSTAVNLQVCGEDLKGKAVYWQMWRGATDTESPKIWNGNAVANTSCIDLTNLDGSGDTLKGVTYYTVVAIEPLGEKEAEQQRTSCYEETSHLRLCDSINR